MNCKNCIFILVNDKLFLYSQSITMFIVTDVEIHAHLVVNFSILEGFLDSKHEYTFGSIIFDVNEFAFYSLSNDGHSASCLELKIMSIDCANDLILCDIVYNDQPKLINQMLCPWMSYKDVISIVKNPDSVDEITNRIHSGFEFSSEDLDQYIISEHHLIRHSIIDFKGMCNITWFLMLYSGFKCSSFDEAYEHYNDFMSCEYDVYMKLVDNGGQEKPQNRFCLHVISKNDFRYFLVMFGRNAEMGFRVANILSDHMEPIYYRIRLSFEEVINDLSKSFKFINESSDYYAGLIINFPGLLDLLCVAQPSCSDAERTPDVC